MAQHDRTKPLPASLDSRRQKQRLKKAWLSAPRLAKPRDRGSQNRILRWAVEALWVVERRISHQITDRVLPAVPGIEHAYGRDLRRNLHLSQATVELPGLDPAWQGARILLVADLHTGPFLSNRDLARALDVLCDLDADLVVLAGDVVSNHLHEFDSHREALSRLRAELGVLTVLGNHEHYTRAPDEMRLRLEGLGFEVLHNRSIEIERKANGRAGGLRFAGIDDTKTGAPDLEAALADSNPSRPTVLVSHNPDILFEAARPGVPLVLSGHTHGGQLRLPGLPPPVTMSHHRFVSGHYRFGFEQTAQAPELQPTRETQLILTRGIGVVGIPLRLFCPPEAVLLTLSAPRAATRPGDKC